jgi:hypothetical protein
MTIYDILKDLIQVKSAKLDEHPLFKKSFNKYMVLRYLSMRKDLLPVAVMCNSLQQNLSESQLYHLLIKLIPRSSNTYISYIKKGNPNEVDDE